MKEKGEMKFYPLPPSVLYLHIYFTYVFALATPSSIVQFCTLLDEPTPTLSEGTYFMDCLSFY